MLLFSLDSAHFIRLWGCYPTWLHFMIWHAEQLRLLPKVTIRLHGPLSKRTWVKSSTDLPLWNSRYVPCIRIIKQYVQGVLNVQPQSWVIMWPDPILRSFYRDYKLSHVVLWIQLNQQRIFLETDKRCFRLWSYDTGTLQLVINMSHR